jgi:hypothetical protein
MNKQNEKNKSKIRIFYYQTRQRENNKSFDSKRTFRRLFASSIQSFRKKIPNQTIFLLLNI